MKKVFKFLNDLAQHNEREWMQEHKESYLESKATVSVLVGNLIDQIGQFDSGIPGLTPKDCMFRINRDIRFSNNKAPYKINFGAAITPGGRKTGNPTYYLHISPGKSMLAGGVYMPDAVHLKKIRQEIDYNADGLKKILSKGDFMETFGSIKGDSLKNSPKGYASDHPDIELLRLKSFLVLKNLPDDFFVISNYEQELVKFCELIQPFNGYFSVALG